MNKPCLKTLDRFRVYDLDQDGRVDVALAPSDAGPQLKIVPTSSGGGAWAPWINGAVVAAAIVATVGGVVSAGRSKTP